MSDYYSAFDLVAVPVVLFDKESGKIIYLNESASSVFKIERTIESGGLDNLCQYPEILSADDVLKLFAGIFTGDSITVKWPVSNNNHIDYLTANITSKLIDSKVTVVASFIEEQDAMYQALFNSANDSIIIFENGVSVDCNPKALELFECSKPELTGIGRDDFFPVVKTGNFMSEECIRRLTEYVEKGTPQVIEQEIKRPNGSTFICEVSLNRSKVNDHSFTIAIFRDVSKRIKSEDKLKAREDFLRTRIDYLLAPSEDVEDITLRDLFNINQLQNLQDALVEALGVSSVFSEVDGTPVTTGESLNGICNLVKDTKVGSSLCKRTSDVIREKLNSDPSSYSISCLSCGFIDSVAPIVIEGKHIGNWFIGQVIPEKFNKNNLLEYTSTLGIKRDKIEKLYDKLPKFNSDYFDKILKLVTVLANELSTLGYNNLKLVKTVREHLELEKQLRQTKNRAEESDRLKSAFLANLSHEIRTPMNGIIGFSDLLQIEEILPEERKEYVTLIKQSSNQLLNIINDIIDISKIESGQVDVNLTTFDVNSVLKEQYAFFKKQAEDKSVDLRMVLPNASDKMYVALDEIKLRQILTNLISNALKFTDYGYVDFGYSMNGDKLLFHVEDTGAGIDDEGVKNIFERFWQSKRNSPNKGGTGLGLAITKAYVELLGGEISVSSIPGTGTKFEFEVPSGN